MNIVNCPRSPRSPHIKQNQDLHDFLQTLFAPWGFGKNYQASDKELRAHIRRLRLPIFHGNHVHFKASAPAASMPYKCNVVKDSLIDRLRL